MVRTVMWVEVNERDTSPVEYLAVWSPSFGAAAAAALSSEPKNPAFLWSPFHATLVFSSSTIDAFISALADRISDVGAEAYLEYGWMD